MAVNNAEQAPESGTRQGVDITELAAAIALLNNSEPPAGRVVAPISIFPALDKKLKELEEQLDAAAHTYLDAVLRCHIARNHAFDSRTTPPSYEEYGATFDAIDALVEKGGVPSQETLDFAVRQKAVGLMEKLIQAGAEPTADILLTAVKGENQFIVRPLVALGAKPDEKVLDYIAEQLDAKGEPVDELIDRAVRQREDHLLYALLATGVTPREDTMYYVLEAGDTTYTEALAAARKPTPEMLDFLMRNKDSTPYQGKQLIMAGVLPSRETLDFIAGKIEDTAYIGNLSYKSPATEEWKEKFIASGGAPEDAPKVLQKLHSDWNSIRTWEDYILEGIRDSHAMAVPAYILDYVAERLNAQGEPLDELLDQSVRQNKAAMESLLLAAGAIPREDTMYFALKNEVTSLIDGKSTVKSALVHARTPTPDMLDFVVREKNWKPDAEDLINAGAIPARETVDYVAERLAETDKQLSTVWELPYAEAKVKNRQLEIDLMEWQGWQRLLEKALNGNPPAALAEKSRVAAEFDSAAREQQPEEQSLVAAVNEASTPVPAQQRPKHKFGPSGILGKKRHSHSQGMATIS